MFFEINRLCLHFSHKHPFFNEIVIIQHFHKESPFRFELMVKSAAILAYKY